MNIPRGFSGYFCIGRIYGGFRIEIAAGFLYRVCLGWVSFGFITYDLEQLIAHGAEHIKVHEKMVGDNEVNTIIGHQSYGGELRGERERRDYERLG